MKGSHCLTILLTIGVAAFFWISWYQAIQLDRATRTSIKATLEESGELSEVHVYPKSTGCYTWKAVKNDVRFVNGKICIGEIK